MQRRGDAGRTVRCAGAGGVDLDVVDDVTVHRGRLPDRHPGLPVRTGGLAPSGDRGLAVHADEGHVKLHRKFAPDGTIVLEEEMFPDGSRKVVRGTPET